MSCVDVIFHPRVTDRCCSALRALCPSLEVLDLSVTRITEAGLQILFTLTDGTLLAYARVGPSCGDSGIALWCVARAFASLRLVLTPGDRPFVARRP